MKKILLLFILIVSTTFAEVKTHLSNMKIVKNDKGGIEKVEAKNV